MASHTGSPKKVITMGCNASRQKRASSTNTKEERECLVKDMIDSNSYESVDPDSGVSEGLTLSQKEKVKLIPADYDFSFENLVMEGGGMKGGSYSGAIKCLEEVGLDKKIKRYAGSSAGAMTAALLAVGYGSKDIAKFTQPKYITYVLDDESGNPLTNLFKSYGLKRTDRLYKEMGKHINERTGSPDTTFKQLFKTFGKELCICVTNVNHMATEYCHAKTTPDLSIRKAVCMSMAIPGYFQAIEMERMGRTDYYCDGGVLCNFPIHCFDGWFLSMKPENSFFVKLQPFSEISSLYYSSKDRFSEINNSTIGIQLYAAHEPDIMKVGLNNRPGALQPKRPSKTTKLYKQYFKDKDTQKKIGSVNDKVVAAMDAFLGTVKKYNLEEKEAVSLEELQQIFADKESFSEEHRQILFGKQLSAEEAFDRIDKNTDGKIEYTELMLFVEETGFCVREYFHGYSRQNIDSFATYMTQVNESILMNLKWLHVTKDDIERTVGINTGHVNTIDYSNMEEEDLTFIQERGYNSMKAFLQHYIHKNSLQPKSNTTTENNDNTTTPTNIAS